jgi:hypothetical protein
MNFPDKLVRMSSSDQVEYTFTSTQCCALLPASQKLPRNGKIEQLKNAVSEHAIYAESRSMDAQTYVLANDIGYFRNSCSMGLRLITILVTERIPAAKRRISHFENMTMNPSIAHESVSRACHNVNVETVYRKGLETYRKAGTERAAQCSIVF